MINDIIPPSLFQEDNQRVLVLHFYIFMSHRVYTCHVYDDVQYVLIEGQKYIKALYSLFSLARN